MKYKIINADSFNGSFPEDSIARHTLIINLLSNKVDIRGDLLDVNYDDEGIAQFDILSVWEDGTLILRFFGTAK